MADPASVGTSPSTRRGRAGEEPPHRSALPHLTRGFLFADLRDFTSYGDEHGDHAAAVLLERYRTLVRGAVAAAGGAEIKTEGDSFYVVFDSASEAVRCGQEILAAADASLGDPIRVGVGVHAGETVETAEGFVGSAVNIAARLCSQARAGELIVSDTVRSLTRTYLDVDFEPIGARRLKGVNDQIGLFRVVPHVATSRARRLSPPRGPFALVAVLGAAVVGLALAAVALTGGIGGRPTASPSIGPTAGGSAASPAASAGASAATSPASSAGALSPAEQVLMLRIPLAFQPYCIRSSATQGSLGGMASLHCVLPAGQPWSGADMVWYDQFDGGGRMEGAVADVQTRQKLATNGTCDGGLTGVIGPWGGITLNGALGCYVKDGAAWIIWTYRGDNIAVRAVRGDGDARALYLWWKDFAGPYLRAD